jgi:hypothetical protein
MFTFMKNVHSEKRRRRADKEKRAHGGDDDGGGKLKLSCRVFDESVIYKYSHFNGIKLIYKTTVILTPRCNFCLCSFTLASRFNSN